MEEKLIKILKENYLIDMLNIEKNDESTVGNVYIVKTKNDKYVLKIYDDINHTKSMISLHTNLSKQIYIPEIIFNEANEGYTLLDNSKYVVVYSFLDGIQIGKLDKLDEEIVKKVALKVRQLHDLTSINRHNLKEVPFYKKYNLERKSLLHFDLTKGNIFYNKEIGFIDFDDAKYGYSIYDVSILMCLLFFSKKRGVDKKNIDLFIDTYYDSDIELKNKEIKYIKEIAIDWINYTLENNEFNPSTEESFDVKKKLIEEFIFSESLIPFKDYKEKNGI